MQNGQSRGGADSNEPRSAIGSELEEIASGWRMVFGITLVIASKVIGLLVSGRVDVLVA